MKRGRDPLGMVRRAFLIAVVAQGALAAASVGSGMIVTALNDEILDLSALATRQRIEFQQAGVTHRRLMVEVRRPEQNLRLIARVQAGLEDQAAALARTVESIRALTDRRRRSWRMALPRTLQRADPTVERAIDRYIAQLRELAALAPDAIAAQFQHNADIELVLSADGGIVRTLDETLGDMQQAARGAVERTALLGFALDAASMLVVIGIGVGVLRPAARRLAHGLARERDMLDGADYGVCYVDRDGRITGFNARFGVLLGLGPADQRDRSLAEAFGAALIEAPGGDALCARAAAARVAEADGEMRAAFEAVARDGRILLVRCVARREERTVTLMDISEMRRRQVELDEARAAAQAASAAKSSFLANMSHEIRTPMNGVIGMAQVLAQTELDAGQRQCVDTITGSGAALLGIINDVLDFSKIEAGKMTVARDPFDLRGVAHDVAAMIAPTAAAKGLDLCVAYDPAAPDRFLGDGGRLRQMLVNLAGNAVKFTETGHVAISVRHQPGMSGGALRIAVSDTGIGIPADRLEAVFDAFEQVAGAPSGGVKGTGLGLSITRRLARLMGGEVAARSTPGVGSTFEIALDLEPVAGAPFAAPWLTGRRILLVDGLAPARAAAAAELGALGAVVTDVAGADAARAALDAAGEAGFDAIVTDRPLAELLTAGAPAPGWAAPPTILVSPPGDLVNAARLRAEGHAAVLARPPRREALAEALAAALESGDGTAGQGRAAPEAASRAPALAGAVVLVVDDNLVNRMVAEKLLENLGCAPSLCEDGDEAIDWLAARRADIVLMDISMPRLGGEAATRILREREAAAGAARLPIVALTAYAETEAADRFRAAGMDAVLTKPIEIEALRTTLTRLLGDRASRLDLAS